MLKLFEHRLIREIDNGKRPGYGKQGYVFYMW